MARVSGNADVTLPVASHHTSRADRRPSGRTGSAGPCPCDGGTTSSSGPGSSQGSGMHAKAFTPRHEDQDFPPTVAGAPERSSLFRPYLPTTREFVRALNLWDTDKDGKIWDSDFDILLYLAYGIELRTPEGSPEEGSTETGGIETGSLEVWRELKARSIMFDGLVGIPRVATLLGKQSYTAELAHVTSANYGRRVSAERGRSRLPFQCMYDHIKAFMRFDRDQNGVVCQRDLMYALSAAGGKKVPLEVCRDMIRLVDSNYDGVLDLLEFINLVHLIG